PQPGDPGPGQLRRAAAVRKLCSRPSVLAAAPPGGPAGRAEALVTGEGGAGLAGGLGPAGRWSRHPLGH
ncbi:MAG: hypothetical protein IRZ08_11140, partial [Frankia sp.]|nr:hypothetical protein [Frankia sp.]